MALIRFAPLFPILNYEQLKLRYCIPVFLYARFLPFSILLIAPLSAGQSAVSIEWVNVITIAMMVNLNSPMAWTLGSTLKFATDFLVQFRHGGGYRAVEAALDRKRLFSAAKYLLHGQLVDHMARENFVQQIGVLHVRD